HFLPDRNSHPVHGVAPDLDVRHQALVLFLQAARYGIAGHAWEIPPVAYADDHVRLAANDVFGDPVQMVYRIARSDLAIGDDVMAAGHSPSSRITAPDWQATWSVASRATDVACKASYSASGIEMSSV